MLLLLPFIIFKKYSEQKHVYARQKNWYDIVAQVM